MRGALGKLHDGHGGGQTRAAEQGRGGAGPMEKGVQAATARLRHRQAAWSYLTEELGVAVGMEKDVEGPPLRLTPPPSTSSGLLFHGRRARCVAVVVTCPPGLVGALVARRAAAQVSAACVPCAVTRRSGARVECSRDDRMANGWATGGRF